MSVNRVNRASTKICRRFYNFGRAILPTIKNEPMLDFVKGSKERENLEKALAQTKKEVIEIPAVVGGKEIFSNNVVEQVMPTKHKHVLAKIHQADAKTMKAAIDAALKAREDWSNMPFEHRAAIYLRAAELLSKTHRASLSAAVMLGTGKNPWQAEIDCAAETADFFRFNVKYAEEVYSSQPAEHAPGTWNRMEYRPLEGFVFAVTPFNFLAIGANLPSAPAIMGNTVLWKPSTTACLGNYKLFKLLQQAGVPDGVINFVPGVGASYGDTIFAHPKFAGLHFTGSTNTFNTLWRTIANNLDKYGSYPRIVGETGGKNFHLAHPSADVENFVNQTIRAAFEYSGQKCSACSRAYVPSNLWPKIKERLIAEVKQIKVGQPDEFDTFMTSVIDKKSFDKITKFLQNAKKDSNVEIIAGGNSNDSEGYFIEPTIIVTKDPNYITMKEELFGPVLTLYVYPENEFDKAIDLANTTATYGLTGSLFCSDRKELIKGYDKLRYASGMFYINDKCTGAVVGQQPFGGSRMSGTNDKAGSVQHMYRWVSMRTIKETFLPIPTWRYPHMS